MEVDQTIIDRIQAHFAARGWTTMPEVNKRRANVFRGQTTLTNERGTAPGFTSKRAEKSGSSGRPHELEWMVATYAPPVARADRRRAVAHMLLKIAGVTESGVEEKLKPYYDSHQRSPDEVHRVGRPRRNSPAGRRSKFGARAALASRETELVAIFEDRIFGYDDDTIEGVIGALLKSRGETLATAGVPAPAASSARASPMSPAAPRTPRRRDRLHRRRDGGRRRTVDGEVPSPSRSHSRKASASASARGRASASPAVAGPGGTPEKFVGTVHIAIAWPDGHRPASFSGRARAR